MDHAFGQGRAFALGVEEELLLVDPATHALAPQSSAIVPRVELPPTDGKVMHDVYEACVETATPIADHALQAAGWMGSMRGALREAGATLMGGGIHPSAALGDAAHVDAPRYEEIGRQLRGLLRRTPTCALHVHVGMPDPGTAIRAFNRMREHLPLLQGLAAHSPFWFGGDSGFATARAQLFRGYPRADVPRTFAGWEDYDISMRQIVAAAGVPDYTFLWWDIRPHPRLGTLEVRAMDAQSRLDSAAGLAALVHGLVIDGTLGPPGDPPPREVLVEGSFRASRDGLDARIWSRGALRPLREVARTALDIARRHARDLGAEDALEGVERILAEGNGADRMRAAHARGGMDAVLELLVRETGAG
ncbi:MAG TPA: YbdK family carboxylate-amine ligase [Solirubrobacteraceae bacterium]|jgi:carboxylate-amine ligase